MTTDSAQPIWASRGDRRIGWARAAVGTGDDAAAAVLLDLLERDSMLTPEVAVELVPGIWDLCATPMLVLSVDRWAALFRRAGYTHDERPAEPPRDPVRLYRGSDPRGEFGMCWSSNPDVARLLASHYPGEGRVWTAIVEPWRLLAFVAPLYEDQYVVDTAGLAPELFEGPDLVSKLDLDVLMERLDAVVDTAAAEGRLP